MKNRIWKRIWMVPLLCIFGVLTVAAQDRPLMRNCRLHQGTERMMAPHLQRATRSRTNHQYQGDRRQLVVLVSFRDQQFVEDAPQILWDRIFNEEGFNETISFGAITSPFQGSIRDYFLAQSYGQFRLTFDLKYIPLAESRVKYRSTNADDENSKYLVSDLVDSLAQQNIDWSPYDWDEDGYVDQLLIIYAGKGMNDGGDSNTIWPHQYWLSKHIGTEARTVSSGGKDYFIDSYCCVQEITRKGDYGSFGTICHEYSHCFGFPDFYRSDKSFVYTWDLMDYGNYNGNGFSPVGYSAFERMFMGWLTPTELTTTTSITSMPPLAEEGVAYLVRNDGHADEYYILENRQPVGWDATIPGQGLVIFHVDYDDDIWLNENEYVNSYEKTRYSIFPANNRTLTSQCKYWGYPYQGNNSLTNESAPSSTLNYANTDGKKLMSKPITDILQTGDLMSFEFMADQTSAVSSLQSVESRPVETLYRMGRIVIVRYSNGEVKKETLKK